MFLESGKAASLLADGTQAPFPDESFYGEDAFITTLSVMVEDNGDLTVDLAANTLRKDGLVAVTECHCLELSVRDVMDAFSNNSNVLRLLTQVEAESRCRSSGCAAIAGCAHGWPALSVPSSEGERKAERRQAREKARYFK